MNPGQTPAIGLGDRGENRLSVIGARRCRDRAFDQVLRVVDEDARRRAIGKPYDAPARRIRCRSRDVGELHRLRVC